MQPAQTREALGKQPPQTARQQLSLLLAGLLYVISFLAVTPLLVMAAPWAALVLGAAVVGAQFTRLRAPGVLRVMSFIFGYGLCAVAVYAALAGILG